MAILPRKRLGPCEILSSIDAGGIRKIYRARDTCLNRYVALKVLPEVFLSDGNRTPHFEPEVPGLVALNHRRIAAIYGLTLASVINNWTAD